MANTQTISSITLEKIPFDNTAVGKNSSPVVIQLSTDPMESERLQYFAIITMTSPTLFTYVDFNITFPINYKIRFYARAVLDGESFYTAAVVPTVSLNLDRIGQIITSNPTLNALYSVEKISNTELKITSRKPGSQYNLSTVLTVTTGLSITYSNFNSDVIAGDGQKISDLYFFVDVFAAANNSETGDVFLTPNTSTFLSIDKLKKPYNQNNLTSFDISPALDAYLNRVTNTNRPVGLFLNNFEIVDFYSNDSIHWRANVGVSYSRGSSDISVEQVYSTIVGKKSYSAALQLEERNDFSEYLTTPVKFRSLRKSLNVKKEEFVPLQFYVTASYDSIEARVFIVFTDGTFVGTEGSVSTYAKACQIYSPYKNLYTYMFKVSELVKAAEISTGKKAKRFNIVICSNNGTTRITEEKKFIIDSKNYEFNRPCIYQNSIGGYDSFVFTGLAEIDGDIDRTYYVDTSLTNYRSGDKYNAVQEVTFTPTIKVSSNYLDKIQYRDLKELVKTRNLYALEPYNQTALVYTATSCQLFQDDIGGTPWINVGSGSNCYKGVNIGNIPISSSILKIYNGYGGADTIYYSTNNFNMRIGSIRATLFNGAVGLGKIKITYWNSGVIIKRDEANLASNFQYFNFYYNEEVAADEIWITAEVLTNVGDDLVRVEFLDKEGILITPLDVQYKYLRILTDDYRDADDDTLKDLTLSLQDTISETSL